MDADLLMDEVHGRERAAEVAVGHAPADLVLEGGRIVDVYTGRIFGGDVAVAGDRIAAVGDVSRCIGERTERVDCRGQFVLPGFVEPHLHIGSSQLTIERLAEVLVARGTVAMSTCFYEPGIVGGLESVLECVERSVGTGLDVLLSPFAGCLGQGELGASRMRPEEMHRLVEHERCVEVREWSYPSFQLPGMRDLYVDTLRRGRVVGGHLEGLTGPMLQGSAALGVCSDHETGTAEEALEKVRAGVIVQVREGSAARDLANVIRAITEYGADASCFAFSTDEQELDSLVEDGHMDHKLRLAVAHGVSPVDAVRMATLGGARSLGVERHYGAVAPGRVASLVVVDDLSAFRVRRVVAQGRLAAEDHRYLLDHSPRPYRDEWSQTVHLDRPLEASDFLLPVDGEATVRVIGVTPGVLVTEELTERVTFVGGRLPAGSGLAKLAIADRHTGSGRLGVAPVRGLDIVRGAVATPINPGAVNLMVLGTDEDDMALAANRVADLGGGIVVVRDGEVRAEVDLPIWGIVSDRPVDEVAPACIEVARALREDLGCPHHGILGNAGFACLPSAIPALKLSDHGLVRVDRLTGRELVSLVVDGDEQPPGGRDGAATTLAGGGR
jgi:adenine deaminase